MINFKNKNKLALSAEINLTYGELLDKVDSLDVKVLPQPIFLNIEKGVELVCYIVACLLNKKTFCILDKENKQRTNWIKTNYYSCKKGGGTWVELDSITKKNFVIEDNSYLVFTSGSTGAPKGIVGSQQHLWEVIQEQASLIGDIKNAGWYLNPSFDASLSDILIPLFLGATLHIPNFKISNIKKLKAHLIENKIDYADLPPRFLDILSPSNTHLKKVLIGGEPASKASIEKWSMSVDLWNSYGPTEATISSSMCKIADDYSNWDKPYLGKPLKDITFIIKNGELLISGRLAKRYFLNEELTKEKFVEIKRISYYRTGDIVGIDNGKFYYIGRKDRQMKIKGVLICPEEIEVFLKPIETAVIEKNNKLVIFTENKSKTSEALKKTNFPKAKLVEVKQLPRTSSGKVDYKSLK